MSDTTPILDPGYNFRTSCTKDDAVQYLMGWLSGPIRENFVSEEERHANYLSGETEYEPTLNEILISMREWAETDYCNAKMERRLHEREVTDEEIAEKLAKLEKCDLEIKQAHQYSCYIDCELAKGSKSALKIDQHTTTNFKYPYIFIASLHEWALDKYQIDIFKPNENEINLRQQYEDSRGELLSRTKETNLQIKFALLAEAYAETATGLKHGGKPNAKAIAEKLVTQSKNSKPPVDGISQNTTEKAISKALKAKNNP